MRKFSLLLLLGVMAVFMFGFVNFNGKNEKTPTLLQKEFRKIEAATKSDAPAAISSYTEIMVVAGGSVSGTVTYAGTVMTPKKLEVTKDVAVCGKEGHVDESLIVGANKGIKDVVVSITGIKQGKSMETLGASFVLDQKVCVYRPHVLVVPINKPVKILNSDGILHNIHTYSKKNPPKNVAQPKFKKELTEMFAHPEAVAVKCDVHGWMSAWIIAVDHPYYAVTDANGKFTIADVPAGTYTVEFWQEKLGMQNKQVTVAASGTTTVDFVYPAAK
ncbi:MAG: carboxypeptidase regulatory-like domain-containing protein [candidate division KSB1 bacterium]|nr:carboxypeptidase regulatory-like domain-containing protein [candidate division KSB1 bacterium]MDZ7368795.1 carboxypeptidase regulatory-like domain-containing protein [candidate division KSB1 bacterium]MDZ7406605.1 carboxypeptidase regulatory-like domain-containing protein [candidate division KSB1 bacterium]